VRAEVEKIRRRWYPRSNKDEEFTMKKITLTAALLALSTGVLWPGEGGPVFQYNDQRFEPKYAYAFQMEIPDLGAMSRADMKAGKPPTKWKKALAISLSDKPFDTPALAKLDPPFDALDRMVQGGALLITVTAGKGGEVDVLRVSLPRSQLALQLDTHAATLTLNPPKGGKVSGRLVIKGDRHMHEFDPEHIPFIEADISFVTAAPVP
jgi:hypothetical protein